VQTKSKEILSIYADENGTLKKEQNVFSGKEALLGDVAPVEENL